MYTCIHASFQLFLDNDVSSSFIPGSLCLTIFVAQSFKTSINSDMHKGKTRQASVQRNISSNEEERLTLKIGIYLTF